MNKVIAALIWVAIGASALAQDFTSTEDRSRFHEVPYKKAEPGMLPPAAYVDLANKALHAHYRNTRMQKFSNGIVTHRFYRNAPAADRDIICVSYVYEGQLGGGGIIDASGDIMQHAPPPVPVLVVLIRKDRSKIYVNEIAYSQPD